MLKLYENNSIHDNDGAEQFPGYGRHGHHWHTKWAR